MPDIKLTMLGDGSGAAGALRDVAHAGKELHEVLEGALKGALGSTVTTFSSLETVAEKATEVIKEFFKESIEEYAKAEAAHRQLKFVAGELTEAFVEQSEAIAKNLAVRDEDIQHMQTLLLRYGAAPEVVGEAVVAIENFSAATGQDANGALMQLIRGVEAGHGSLGRMGVQFDATGDKAHDFKAAVEALNEKFGGAAETEAGGLTGQMRAAEIAVEDLKKSIGALFAAVEGKLHILAAFSAYLNTLRTSGSIGSATVMAAATAIYGPGASGAVPTVHGEAGEAGDIEVGIGKLTLKKTPGASGSATKAIEEAAAMDARLRQQEEFNKRWIKNDEAFELEQETRARKSAEKIADDSSEELQRRLKAEAEFEQKALNQLAEAEQKAAENRRKQQERADAEMESRFRRNEQMWKDAGDRMGAALVNAIAAQLQRLAQGGDVDPAAVAGDVTQTVLTIVGGLVGTYFGAPQLGGAIGGLVGTGVNFGIRAGFGRKSHDGGWVERFHGGGWSLGSDEQPAILQTGERVLSRREVSNMGGRGGVEAAARGRMGTTVVNISAVDAKSFADSMGSDGGRGFYNALRVGRGDVVPLFSRG